jgi:phage repressor protein C with HTH and peptisase S24 domain
MNLPEKNEVFEKIAFGLRVEEIAKRVGGVKLLAEKSNLRTNQLYRYIQGLNMPGVDVVAALALAAGVSVAWLINGQGDMDASASRSPEGYVPVRMYPTPERTDMALMGTDIGRFALNRHYLEYVLGVKPDQVFFEFVSDDTMEPTFFSGDMVLVDAGRDSKSFCDGVYLLRKNTFLAVMRVQWQPGNKVKLLRDNEKYKDVIVSTDGWYLIGPVVAVWRHLHDNVPPESETKPDLPPLGVPVFGL